MQIINADPTTVYTLSSFESAVGKADDIETMPIVAQKLMQLTSTDDFSMDAVSGLVKSDPVISARILRVASSSAYGARPANTLNAALVRIGIRDLRQLVMASAMIGGKTNTFTKKLWSYSLKVAAISDSIAKKLDHQPFADPFLCGLLHDFGTIVMNQVIGKRYRTTIGEPCLDSQREREITAYGFDHCDLGVMIAQAWRLFDALEHVMQHHHTPLIVDELDIADASKNAVYLTAIARHAVIHPIDETTNAIILPLCERLRLSNSGLIECRDLGMSQYDETYATLLVGS